MVHIGSDHHLTRTPTTAIVFRARSDADDTRCGLQIVLRRCGVALRCVALRCTMTEANWEPQLFPLLPFGEASC
jgi:hypothetical protein